MSDSVASLIEAIASSKENAGQHCPDSQTPISNLEPTRVIGFSQQVHRLAALPNKTDAGDGK